MPSALIREIDPGAYENLKQRAKQRGRSFEAELRVILHEAASESSIDMLAEARHIRASFKGQKFPDSTKDIRIDRER